MEAPPSKACSRCREEKTPSDFHKDCRAHDGLQKYCKPCNTDHLRQWRKDNPEAAKVRRRQTLLRSKYNLTFEDFDRLWAAHSGRCAICSHPLSLEGGSKGHAVDHNHTTGEVRGLLCPQCNMGLGKFRDNPALLLTAHHYLNERGHYGIAD